MFQDRESAGEALAARVAALPSLAAGQGPPPLVLALPRGGIPVALPIARALGAPLDLLLVRKIGAPGQPELALGAVVEGDPPLLVLNEDIVADLGVEAGWIAAARDRELEEIARRRALLLAGAPPPALAGRRVVLVDDGVATGASAGVALRAVRAAGAVRAVLAVPVIAAEVAARFRAGPNIEVVALAEPEMLGSVGAFYRDFHQLDDAEVLALLARAPRG